MAQRTPSNSTTDVPHLRVARSEVAEAINTLVREAAAIRARWRDDGRTSPDADRQQRAWQDRVLILLQKWFTDGSERSRFRSRTITIGLTRGIKVTPNERLQLQIDELTALRDRLDAYDETATAAPAAGEDASPDRSDERDVFIVHGHDREMREAVARCLASLKLNPIILDEQPDGGLTVIEKFEKHGAKPAFAVVLLSPDDESVIRGADGAVTASTRRARQNVIFELGYFLGTLGRSRVRALHRERVELPSDLAGVLYVPFDESGAWRLRLAREMRAAGLPIDLNDLAPRS